MDNPTAEQRQLLDQLPPVAGELGPVLAAQFAACRTEPTEDCDECFYVSVPAGTPLVPPDAECPLYWFEAGPKGDGVLVWHENGVVDFVEIMFFDEHPTLADIGITGGPATE